MFIKILLENKIARLITITSALAIAAVAFLFVQIALAKSKSDIVYPAKELGNCKNEKDCFVFCESPTNILACVNFAEKHNLMSREQVSRARAYAKTGERGPGNCKNQKECLAFCDNPANFDACLDFAEKTNLLPPAELKEARLVAKALKAGAKLPGGCVTKSACEDYCDDAKHMNECLDFAEKAGFMSREDLAEARKAAKAFEKGLKSPGNCRGKKQCENFCAEPSNIEECLNFAEAAGFMSEAEINEARKVMPLIARGEMPGGCRSKGQCEKYCENEDHFEECSSFALKAGFMTPEEAEILKKTGGKTPGNCRGKEQCETFCENPANQEICFEFGRKYGLIPEEQLEEMREGVEQLREGLESASEEVLECLNSRVGAKTLEQMLGGTGFPGPQVGDKIRGCFEEFSGPRGDEGFEDFDREDFDAEEGQQTEPRIMGPSRRPTMDNRGRDKSEDEEEGPFFAPEDKFKDSSEGESEDTFFIEP